MVRTRATNDRRGENIKSSKLQLIISVIQCSKASNYWCKVQKTWLTEEVVNVMEAAKDVMCGTSLFGSSFSSRVECHKVVFLLVTEGGWKNKIGQRRNSK